MKILPYSALFVSAVVGIWLGRASVGADRTSSLGSAGSEKDGRQNGLPSAMIKGHGLPLSGSDLEIALEIRRRIDDEGAEVYPEMWAALGKLPNWRSASLREILLGWWVVDDPQTALATEGVGDDPEMRALLLRAWAVHDLDAAMAATEKGRGSLIEAVASRDLAAGIAGARKYGVEMPIDLVTQWVKVAPLDVFKEVERSGSLIPFGHLDWIAELRKEADLLADLQHLAELPREGGLGSTLMRRMLSADGERCSLEVAEWIVGHEDVPDRSWLIDAAFASWGSVAPGELREWLRGIDAEHPHAREIAEVAIASADFGAEHADELFRFLDLLPEYEREREAARLAEYGRGTTAERLARVEMLRDELIDEKYLTSLRNAYEDVPHDGNDEFQRSILEMSDRFPDLSCSYLFRSYSRKDPEGALPWLVGEGVAEIVRTTNLSNAMRSWGEVDRMAMLEFVDQEMPDESDRIVARKVIRRDQLPRSIQKSLEERFNWLRGDEDE